MRLFAITTTLLGCLFLNFQGIRAQELNPVFGESITEEKLPMPLTSNDSSPPPRSLNQPRKAEIKHASRVERAKYVAANRLYVETVNRWYGIDTARPNVNSGYVFLAPPRVSYRWFGPAQPTYTLPFGYPLP